MKAFLIVVKVAVTALLLWFLLHRIPFADVSAAVGRADPALVALGVLVLAAQPLIGALRWITVLRRLGIGMPVSDAVGLTYIGVFFNQALPASVGGDGLKIWLCRRLGYPLSAAVNSVSLDRLVMLLGLVLMVGASKPWLADHLGVSQLTLLAPLLLFGGAAGIALVALADRLPPRWGQWSLVRGLAALAVDTRRIFLDFRTLAAVLGLSLLSYLNMTASAYFFLLSLGQEVAIGQAIVLVPPVLLASSLPVSLGGWGTREVAMVASLGIAGVAPPEALLTSIFLGLASIVVSLPGVPTYLLHRRRDGAKSSPAIPLFEAGKGAGGR
jgi:uncharacterized membrane protein YbhN (UPF0104 family)